MFVIVLGTFTAKAQKSKLGLTAGYSETNMFIKFDGNKESESFSGFFVGINPEFSTKNEKLNISPSVIYSSYKIDGDDERFESLQIPVLLKYYLDTNFNLQAGPQVNYVLEEAEDETNNLSIGLTIGAGYNLTKKLSINLNYHFQISNSYDGEYNDDVFFGLNYLNIGLTFIP